MASPAFSIGANAVGAKASISAGGAVVATLNSISGVTSTQWSIVGTDETGGTYTLALSGPVNSVCTTTALAEGTAAGLKCTICGGIDPQTGQPSAAMSTVVKFYVPTSAGYEVGFAGEKYESNSVYGATGIINAPIRGLSAISQDEKRSVRLATAAALPANTRVGNVLTANANASINGVGIDGKTDIAAAQRVLVKDEATGANDGLYSVTQLGSGSLPWILTRSTDADTSAELTTGATVYVEEGTANGGQMWQMQTLAVDLNTTAQVWKRIPGIADATDLDAATSAATASKLVRRDASAGAVFAALTGTTVTASTELVTTSIDTGAATDLTVQRNNTSILAVNSTGVRLSGALANAIVDVGTAATALDFKIRAATSTAGNADGGDVLISGGTANGSGLKGGVQLNLSTDTDVMLETREVAVGRRFIGLCRGSAVTTTQLPAGTGDLVLYVGDCATAPTVAPVGGVVLYSTSGVLKTCDATGYALSLSRTGDPMCPPVCDPIDGNLTNAFGATVTLAKDMAYGTVVNAGTINTNGYRLLAAVRVDNQATGVIHNDGAAGAAGGTAGAAGGSGTLTAGGAGGAGGTAAGSAGSNQTNSDGGAGGLGGTGASGAGGAGGTATAPAASQGSLGGYLNAFFNPFKGGGGGGGGGGDGTAGGGGGGSAGPVVIHTPWLNNDGIIRANGGAGGSPAAGNRGAGAGGGAAYITIVTGRETGSGTIAATGGTGGTGSGTGTNGANGSNGNVRRIKPQ